jgi:elongation factor Ts
MSVTAETVKQLRERTGAGMMECKRALVETGGNLDAAAELMRKQGLAKADKKAARIAAEGMIVIEKSADGRSAAMVEVNCETDFVAREQDFGGFAADVARVALAARVTSVEALLAAKLPAGETVDERRGENISVRRVVRVEAKGQLGAYIHGTRIGALVSLDAGEAGLARDLAMHVAASNPKYLSVAQVPADEIAKEREIFIGQAKSDPKNQGKPDNILAQIVEGKVRKALAEITLLGQPFVRDDKVSVEKLLAGANAKLAAFERYEVGAGIEKKQGDFAAEVMAQVKGAAGGKH